MPARTGNTPLTSVHRETVWVWEQILFLHMLRCHSVLANFLMRVCGQEAQGRAPLQYHNITVAYPFSPVPVVHPCNQGQSASMLLFFSLAKRTLQQEIMQPFALRGNPGGGFNIPITHLLHTPGLVAKHAPLHPISLHFFPQEQQTLAA